MLIDFSSQVLDFVNITSNENILRYWHIFFVGPMGSSKMRMSESRRRTYLYNQLAILEKQITTQWNQIKADFGDTVTYNGRHYLDKMQFDKLEMLHYLQEERRLNYLHSYTTMAKHSELNSSFNNVL